MGTNYYLIRKIKYKDNIKYNIGCDEDFFLELKNGYVWNYRYYKNIEQMNKDFFQRIHIGKSSFGWRFLLCTYNLNNEEYKFSFLDKKINSLDDWIELFNDPNNYILDEYDRKIDKEKMIDIITKREGIYSEHQLRKHSFSNEETTMPDGYDYDLILSDEHIFC